MYLDMARTLMTTIENRRRFLAKVGAAGLVSAGLGTSTAERPRSPGERLNVAVVGCGGQGGENLGQIGDENIVALCDVDERRASAAFEKYPKARCFRDYRRMLDAVQREIDAVVVSTPDHMHAPICLAAMDLHKHVYCEKPLTWGIEEVRKMARVARENRVATQMGTQGLAGDRARAGIEMTRSGVLGEVTELHVWTDRAKGWWPQGVKRPAAGAPARDGLEWDLWLGVAPARPYHAAYSPFVWRGWKDFGTGAVGDMGIHNAAMPFVGLELGPPDAVEVVDVSEFESETFPTWSRLRLTFPARAGRGRVVLNWYDGGHLPPAELIPGHKLAPNGAIVVGTKATLYSVDWTGGDWHLLPDGKFRDLRAPAPSLPRAPRQSHHQEWLQACRGGPPTFCRFDGFAAALTETMLVANLALRTGHSIRWDATTMTAPGSPDAETAIHRPYRAGW